MNVTIAGAHGQIALRLARLLAARGDRVRGLVRNPEHVAAVQLATHALSWSHVESTNGAMHARRPLSSVKSKSNGCRHAPHFGDC